MLSRVWFWERRERALIVDVMLFFGCRRGRKARDVGAEMRDGVLIVTVQLGTPMAVPPVPEMIPIR